MTVKQSTIYYSLGCVLIAGVLLFAVNAMCLTDSNSEGQRVEANEPCAYEKRPPPIIIWFHNFIDPPEAAKLAISSGLVSHVMVKYMHRADRDWRQKKTVVEAIRIVKQSEAKLIWCRNLWPYYNIGDVRAADFFDPNYYINEIKNLRMEADEMGADFCALDLEAYGSAPMKCYTQWPDRIRLTQSQWKQLEDALAQAVETMGKVDFVLGAGSIDKTQPINVLSRLGKMRITGWTYWSNEERLDLITFEYEIFGAYINTVREDENHPKLKHYLVREIFEKSGRWSDKCGLYLLPKEKNALAMAKELVAYAESLPNVNCIQEQKPNSGR